MIRKATKQDIDQVEKGYTEFLLYEQEHGAHTAWKLGVYPTRANAIKDLADGSLYVLEQDGEICASIVVNRDQPEEYKNVKWKYPALPEEILVIHRLCVRPSMSRRGIGRAMVRFAAEEGERQKCKAIRLDTGAQNTPAFSLYEKMGYELTQTASIALGGVIAHDGHRFYEKPLSAAKEGSADGNHGAGV